MLRSTRSPLTTLLFVFVVGAGLVAFACSSPQPGAACAGPYTVPAGTDLTKPEVSFRNDVMPIFIQSCAFRSSCHGAPVTGDLPGSGNEGVYLGEKPPAESPDPARVRGGIVGVKSAELPTMSFVTPRDPSQSYLMHKIDGDQCALDAKCTNDEKGNPVKPPTCKSSMPRGSALLPASERDTIRRWIAQGAQDN